MSEQRLDESFTASSGDPQLIAVEDALRRGDLQGAESLINGLLERADDNTVARRFSGDLALRRGHIARAETAYRACLERAPSYGAARHGLATALFRQMRLGEAGREAEQLLADTPGDTSARTLKAALAASIGNHRESIELYRGLVSEHPDAAPLWVGLGHGYRIVGELGPAVAAYREAIARNPRLGEAYWSLANLKSFDFTESDIGSMTTLAGDSSLPDGDRAAVEFALGQAFLARDETQSFEHFRRGNAAKRRSLTYDAAAATASLQRWTELFTSDRMRSIVSVGDSAHDPIFVVGLPRSGSTLIEQILGSHPQIEATSELPYLDLVGRRASETGLEPDRDWAALGQDYLTLARANRWTTRPFFVDKRPNNFAHIGLIRLILPNAKIIDIRRHPLAACLSIYRQLFARGRPYAYDLAEIAHWYRAYVAAMDRFDVAFPGYVHHIRYEALVDDTEGEVRRLLNYVGVPFDPACLRFHANGQPVRTPSSEQVRRPIFRDALTEWQRYREQLAPAAELLGDLIDAYPSAPGS